MKIGMTFFVISFVFEISAFADISSVINPSCTAGEVNVALKTALDYLVSITCLRADLTGSEKTICAGKMGLGAGITASGAGYIKELNYEKANLKLLANGTKTTQNAFLPEIEKLTEHVNIVDKKIIKMALEDANLLNESSATFKALDEESKVIGGRLRERLLALQDLRHIEAKYNAEILSANRASRQSKLGMAGGIGLLLLDMKGSEQCALLKAKMVSDADEKCQPIPQLGNSEVSFLKSSIEEQQKILKQNPELCSHYKNIVKNLEQKIDIMKMAYFDGNKITDLNCRGQSVSYKIKGNAYVGNATIKVVYNDNRQLRKMELNAGSKPYVIDYATNGKTTQLQRLSWDSNDPKDKWRGGRSVLASQLSAAHENPSVEQAVLFDLIHFIQGQSAVNCCFENRDCENIQSSTSKAKTKKQGATR